MSTKIREAVLIEKKCIGDRAYWLKLMPIGPFSFVSGQFVSLQIPGFDSQHETVWRCYSFANAGDESSFGGIELFVRIVNGGRAGEYFSKLKPGDHISFRGPYGDFVYHPGTRRAVVMISTNTGLAPLRSIARSQEFQQDYHPFRLALLGFRYAKDIPYPSEFADLKVDFRFALSREESHSRDYFHGHVTDFLRKVSPQFPWTNCDYYICGNNEMIQEVLQILKLHQVAMAQIHFEAFEPSKREIRKIA